MANAHLVGTDPDPDDFYLRDWDSVEFSLMDSSGYAHLVGMDPDPDDFYLRDGDSVEFSLMDSSG